MEHAQLKEVVYVDLALEGRGKEDIAGKKTIALNILIVIYHTNS